MAEQASTVVIYTGEGKGKTTAALGHAVATAADGKRAVVVQFLKGGGYTGELFSQTCFFPNLTIRQFGYGCPISGAIRRGETKCCKCGECFGENRNPERGFAEKALVYAEEVLDQGDVDLLVLDEISHALRHKLIDLTRVENMIRSRPEGVNMVLTGRQMPESILNLADRITACRVVKHPIASGIDARRGSEY